MYTPPTPPPTLDDTRFLWSFSAAGDKPYRCNVCSAQFNRPANLKTHARIHSGEKPYRCDTCGARFVQVRAHTRRKHCDITTDLNRDWSVDCGLQSKCNTVGGGEVTVSRSRI